MRFSFATLVLLCAAAAAVSCSSTDEKKPKHDPEHPEFDTTALLDDQARIGGRYKTGGFSTGFYYNVPNYVKLLPDEYLGRGHIVQLLSVETDGGWARVKNEDHEIGYVKFDKLRIVPSDEEPEADDDETADEILDRRLRKIDD